MAFPAAPTGAAPSGEQRYTVTQRPGLSACALDDRVDRPLPVAWVRQP